MDIMEMALMDAVTLAGVIVILTTAVCVAVGLVGLTIAFVKDAWANYGVEPSQSTREQPTYEYRHSTTTYEPTRTSGKGKPREHPANREADE